MQNDIVVTQSMVNSIKLPFTAGRFDWHAYSVDNDNEGEGVYSFGIEIKSEYIINENSEVNALLSFMADAEEELKGWVPILYLIVDYTHGSNNEMIVYHNSIRPDLRFPLGFIWSGSSTRVGFKNLIAADIQASIASDIIKIMQQDNNKDEFFRNVEACCSHISKLIDNIDFFNIN